MKMPDIVPIGVKGVAINETRMDISARSHSIIIDEPAARGGGDAGPLPIEMFIASFASCTHVISNWIAADLNIELMEMEVDIQVDFDTRAAVGDQMIIHPFPQLRMEVKVTTDGTAKEITQLKEELSWRCPISATIRASGCEVVENWKINHLGN